MSANGKADRPDVGFTQESAADPTAGATTDDADTAVKISPTAQALIGRRLEALYKEVVQQQVPDHLLRLLDELERKEPPK